MDKISLKENDLVLIDLFGKGQLYENKLDENLEYMKKYLQPDDYAKKEHFYKVERNEYYFQQLIDKDLFTLKELYQLINNQSIRIQTKNGNRVFVRDYQGIDDEEPTYTFDIGSVYDDYSEVKVGSIVEYVPNIYVKMDIDYFTRGKVISGLNGETENLRYCDIIVELENGSKKNLCWEEFLLIKS